jgi:hypothetical protein
VTEGSSTDNDPDISMCWPTRKKKKRKEKKENSVAIVGALTDGVGGWGKYDALENMLHTWPTAL